MSTVNDWLNYSSYSFFFFEFLLLFCVSIFFLVTLYKEHELKEKSGIVVGDQCQSQEF